MIKKKKICEDCLNECYYWKGKKCKSCSSKNNPQKPIKKKHLSKKPSEKQLDKREEKKERTKEIHQAMYNWWLKQEKNQCMSCGCNLPKEFHTWMVDHLIEKSNRPDLALEEWNFYLTCFDDHSRKTNGFPSLRHAQAIEQAKLYDKFLKELDKTNK